MNDRKLNPIMVIKGNQIEYINKSFISIFGKTKKDYISKKLKEAMPVEIFSVFEELLQCHDEIKELKIKGKKFSVSSFIVKKTEESKEAEDERIALMLQDINEYKKDKEECKS